MKTVLCAVNSSYVHTNPAVRSIAAAVGGNAVFCEFNINQMASDVLRALLLQEGDVYAFSCYIWNIAYVLRLAEDIKKAEPEAVITLGGPEVSFRAKSVIEQYWFVDYVICGEAEECLKPFLEGIKRNARVDMPGIVFREGRAACGDDAYQVVSNLDTLPSPFAAAGDEYDENKIYYYESSRGCPFSCAYCLSGDCMGVREKSLEHVFDELQIFVKKGVKLVKFVDRTFNANKTRAKKIVEYVIGKTENTSFHFEVALDLMDDELLCLLASAPTGKIQLEGGVQTTNKRTLDAVARKTDLSRLKENAKAILKAGNIHLHLDLIAGLPYESMERFALSFDEIYELYPDALQLGFLKVLHGTKLEQQAGGWGLISRSYPPYEVIRTKDISARELLYIKGIEELLNRYYNTGRAKYSLQYLTQEQIFSPFELYAKLYDFCVRNDYTGRPVSARNQFVLLIEFAKETLCRTEQNVFLKRLRTDYDRTKIKGIIPRELQETD